VTTRKNARVGVTTDSKIPWTPERGPLLSPREAAARLGVTERQIVRLRREYALPFVKAGGLYRFHIDDLDAYIAAQRNVVE
jgi:excisionase family DNA binding protein